MATPVSKFLWLRRFWVSVASPFLDFCGFAVSEFLRFAVYRFLVGWWECYFSDSDHLSTYNIFHRP